MLSVCDLVHLDGVGRGGRRHRGIAGAGRARLLDQLLGHVTELTGVEMAGRSLGSKGIEAAAAYIAGQFRAAGIAPLSRGYFQNWTQQLEIEGIGESDSVNESAYKRPVRLSNIFGVLKGSNPDLNGKPVVVGAHFDHLGVDSVTGEVYPGADDNASGVAIMLEVAAKLVSSFAPQRPVIFVAFTGEESGLLGSKYFVENLPSMFNKDEIFAMVNLDSVGRLNGRELQVFGTGSAYEFPFMAQGIGFTTGLQSTFPQQTIASSDHISFLNEGVPGIHLFGGVTEDYHRPSDTADKLDLDGMSDIALWLEEAIVYLADNTDPLRVTLAGASVLSLKDIFQQSFEFNYFVLIAISLSFFFSYITVKFFLDYINKFSLNIFVAYRMMLGIILFIMIYN